MSAHGLIGSESGSGPNGAGVRDGNPKVRVADHPSRNDERPLSCAYRSNTNNSLKMGNSSAHRFGERYFFALICNRTGHRIF